MKKFTDYNEFKEYVKGYEYKEGKAYGLRNHWEETIDNDYTSYYWNYDTDSSDLDNPIGGLCTIGINHTWGEYDAEDTIFEAATDYCNGYILFVSGNYKKEIVLEEDKGEQIIAPNYEVIAVYEEA